MAIHLDVVLADDERMRVRREREEIVFIIKSIARVLCCIAMAVVLLGAGHLSAAPAAGKVLNVGYSVQGAKGCQQALTYRAYVAQAATSLRAAPPKRVMPAPSLKRELPKIPKMRRVDCYNDCDAVEGDCSIYCDSLPPGERFRCYDDCFWAHEYCYCDCGWCGGVCSC